MSQLATSSDRGSPLSGRRVAGALLAQVAFGAIGTGVVFGAMLLLRQLGVFEGPPAATPLLVFASFVSLLALRWSFSRAGDLRTVGWVAIAPRDTLQAIAGGFVYVLAIASVLNLLFNRGVELPRGAPIVRTPSSLDFAVILVVGALVAPFVEETLFRGALFGWLLRRWNAWVAVPVTAVAFAALHGPTAPIIVFHGLLFGYVRLRTGSLWPSFLMHAVNNGLALTGLFLSLHGT